MIIIVSHKLLFKREKMRKLVVAFAISSLFASFAMALSSSKCGTDKACIKAEAWKDYYYNRSKCGNSNSLSAKLCRLSENLRIK